MKASSLLILLASLAIAPGCSTKKGCTDAAATNYDSDAKDDDGSCTYAADMFVGNYSGSETVRKASDNSLVETRNVVFTIEKADNSKIKILLFPATTSATTCETSANVSGSSLVGTDFGNCPWDNSFTASLNGTSLTYSFVDQNYYNGTTPSAFEVNVSGTVTKLN